MCVHHFIPSAEYVHQIAHSKYSNQHKGRGCLDKSREAQSNANKWMLLCVAIYYHEFVLLAFFFFPNGDKIAENRVIKSFHSALLQPCQVKHVSRGGTLEWRCLESHNSVKSLVENPCFYEFC